MSLADSLGLHGELLSLLNTGIFPSYVCRVFFFFFTVLYN